MKFVFNDSLTASISSEVNYLPTSNIITNGLILEKKLVTSATLNTVDDLVDAFKKLTTEAEKAKLLKSADAINLLKDPDKMVEFHKKVGSFGGSGRGSGTGPTDIVGKLNQQMIEGAENVSRPGSVFAPFLESKDQIIQRLKPFLSEQQIGEVFDKLENILPFTETIGVLEFIIQKSRSCNAKTSDVINFFIDHFSQKAQYSLAKRLVDLGCEFQKLNPSIDVFSVLRDAVAGNQPAVGLGYLAKDPESQKDFNNLIELSQSNLPEQSEEIRRRFQKSRVDLQAQEEKVNMQRAIYDMMKTEEMNNQLIKMVQFLGQSFEFLLTNPMFRALKDMFYDLNASKIILNQASSIFTSDTSPITPSKTPFEEQQQREDTFTSIPQGRNSFSNNEIKYLKLASPDITRHIYAQTAPQTASQNSNNNQENRKEASNALQGFANSIAEIGKNTIEKIKNFLSNFSDDIKKIWNESFIPRIIKIFESLQKAVITIVDSIKNNSFTIEVLNKTFGDVGNAILGRESTGNPLSGFLPGDITKDPNLTQVAPKPGVKANFYSNRLAQRTPQQGTTLPGSSKISGYITNGIGIVSTIAATIFGAISLRNALASMIKDPRQWSSIVNAIFPMILGVKDLIKEVVMATNLVGSNAPNSSLFLDQNGRITPQGLAIMANNRETMISLGIADDDAMALSKFAVQKEYYMSQLRTKESNLQSAESQAVQTGNPRTPETTVGDLPTDFQNKLKDFLNFCGKIENEFKGAVTLFRNAIANNQKNYNDTQKNQASGRLAELEKDLIEIQSKKSEWSSMKNIAAHMMRKRVLIQKLKPLQTQLDTMKKLGIPISNIIASPNGILAQVGRIRSEEQQALDKLRKEYYEKMDLLKNPDKIAPLVKYPTDTGVTKLPESPDQSDTNKSPFEVPEGSQFKLEENPNSGAI